VHALVIHPDGNTSQFGSSILHLNAASPQNKTFVYTNNPTGNSDIYLNSPSLDVPQALASNPAQDTNPQLSPFNQYILFTSDRSGNRDLYMMSGTGENPRPVFAHPAEDYHPAWEPGGTRGVFVSERDGNPELYLAELDPNAIQGEISYGEDALDTTKPPVRGKQGDAVGVQFQSMAGLLSHFLIYIAADPSPFTWKILGYDGSFPTETVIAEGEALPGAIGWNRIETHNVPIPETYLIAVYFQQENQPGIGLARGGRTGKWWSFSSESQQWQWNSYIPYMIKAFVNLPNPTRLTDHSASDVEPCWSPTGKQIVFASDRGGKMDLWVMNDDGSQLKQLTQSAGNNTKPAWSSDGTMIAFVSDRDGNPELYIIQPDGTGERRLTTFEGVDTDPAWESFGRTLLFASNRNGRMEIYQADAVNFYPARLTITNGEALEPHVAMHSRLTAKLAAKSLRPRAGSMQMNVSSGQGIPGDTIPIQVEIQSAMSVGNWEGSLRYDARLLELTQAQMDVKEPGVLYAINPDAYPSDTGTIRWNWINTIGLSGDSAVLTLNFRIRNQTDPTEAHIQCLAIHAYGLDLVDIPLLSEDGYIQILKDPTIIQEWMMF
jgi:Tol biopolymer transport system component